MKRSKDVEEKEKESKKLSRILIAGALIVFGALIWRNRILERNYYRKVGECENLKDMLCGYQRISERNAFSLGKLSREKYERGI